VGGAPRTHPQVSSFDIKHLRNPIGIGVDNQLSGQQLYVQELAEKPPKDLFDGRSTDNMSARVRTFYNAVVGVVSRQHSGIMVDGALNPTGEHLHDRCACHLLGRLGTVSPLLRFGCHKTSAVNRHLGDVSATRNVCGCLPCCAPLSSP
jgi:hypothetical protein